MKKFAIPFFIFVTLLCSGINYGFLGTDEYWTGMTRYLPANLKSPSDFYEAGDVKSPLQLIPFWTAAKFSSFFGASDSFSQYRWMLVIIGFLQSSLLLWGLNKQKSSLVSFNFLSIYFLLYFPILFSLTRPMFESLAAPWVFLAGIFAHSYYLNKVRSHMLLGVLFICFGFMVRPQVGLCALTFPILCILNKNWKDLAHCSVLGISAFVMLGFLDGSLVNGGFHPSLFNLITYNLNSGSEYGSQSIFTYPLLLLGFGFIPWLIYKGSVLLKKDYWLQTFPYWLMIFLFVLTHSIFSQKFERFLIPILPLFALALLPVFVSLWQNKKQHSLRLYSLLALNGLLWIAATWFPAQGNIIELSRYLNKHPEINSVYVYKNEPDWITEIFIDHKVELKELSLGTLDLACQNQTNRLLVNEGSINELSEPADNFQIEKKISTNPFDHLAYIINPNKNKRRSPLLLLSCKSPKA